MYLHSLLGIFRLTSGVFRFACLQLSSLVTAASSKTCTSPVIHTRRAWTCPGFHCTSLSDLPHQACVGSNISSPVSCLVYLFFTYLCFRLSPRFLNQELICVSGLEGMWNSPPLSGLNPSRGHVHVRYRMRRDHLVPLLPRSSFCLRRPARFVSYICRRSSAPRLTRGSFFFPFLAAIFGPRL